MPEIGLTSRPREMRTGQTGINLGQGKPIHICIHREAAKTDKSACYTQAGRLLERRDGSLAGWPRVL
jgi:hypothetical protein